MKKLKTLPLLLSLSVGFICISPVFAKEGADKSGIITMKEQAKAKHYTHVADSYIRGLNEKDLEGILSLYADNGTVEDPVGSKEVVGMAALRKFYSGAVTIDLTLTRTGPVRVGGNEAAFPFQLRMDVDGKPMITDIIDVFRFDEAGKIVSMRAFWGPTNRQDAAE